MAVLIEEDEDIIPKYLEFELEIERGDFRPFFLPVSQGVFGYFVDKNYERNYPVILFKLMYKDVFVEYGKSRWSRGYEEISEGYSPILKNMTLDEQYVDSLLLPEIFEDDIRSDDAHVVIIPQRKYITIIGTKRYTDDFIDDMIEGTVTTSDSNWKEKIENYSQAHESSVIVKKGMHSSGKGNMIYRHDQPLDYVYDYSIIQPVSEMFNKCTEFRVFVINGTIRAINVVADINYEPANNTKISTSFKKRILELYNKFVSLYKDADMYPPLYLRIDVTTNCTPNERLDVIINPNWNNKIYLNEFEPLANGAEERTQIWVDNEDIMHYDPSEYDTRDAYSNTGSTVASLYIQYYTAIAILERMADHFALYKQMILKRYENYYHEWNNKELIDMVLKDDYVEKRKAEFLHDTIGYTKTLFNDLILKKAGRQINFVGGNLAYLYRTSKSNYINLKKLNEL